MRLLVVEDYLPLLKSMEQGLREAGFAVDVAADGAAGLSLARTIEYDVVVLDLMLPGVPGQQILEALRRERNEVPVVVLTARKDLSERVRLLDVGADDYLTKPFALAELLARVRAVMRRRYGRSGSVVSVGDLRIDTTARVVTRGDQVIELSAREYALLEYLASRRGHVVTRAEIWDHVYDFSSEPSSNVVDVYVGYLRRKVDRGFATRLIHTRRGMGYVLEEERRVAV